MEGQAAAAAPVTETPVAPDASTDATETAAQAEAKRKLKVKIDGVEQEFDEDEVIRDFGKGRAADKKFQEAAALRKEAVSFIEALKKDPLSVLTNPKLGINLREIAETHLLSILEDEMMDPKDRELRDLKKEKSSREEREAAEEAARKEVEEQARVEHHRQKYEQEFQACLDASGLPKTPFTVKRLAHYMRMGMMNGLELSPQDVAHKVKEEYMEEQKSLFSGLDGENLLKLLGDDLAKKIRKFDTSRVVSPGKATLMDQPRVSEKAASKRPDKISKEDWKAKMDRIKAGLE